MLILLQRSAAAATEAEHFYFYFYFYRGGCQVQRAVQVEHFMSVCVWHDSTL